MPCGAPAVAAPIACSPPFHKLANGSLQYERDSLSHKSLLQGRPAMLAAHAPGYSVSYCVLQHLKFDKTIRPRPVAKQPRFQ